MKKIVYLVIALLILNMFIISNVSIGKNISRINNFERSEEWAVTFGGSNIDVGHFVQQTTDAGYIITGYTRSYGTSGRNIWLIKTDYQGNELWNKTFGGTNDEEGKCVQQTTDGGYIITGYTKSYGAGGEDLWLIKTDSQGNEQWNKVFGGGQDDGGMSVLQTTDGSYIVAGYTSSSGAGSVDAWLLKTDSQGNQQWSKTLGGSSSDGARCIKLTNDGGLILTGWTMSYGPSYLFNVWLVKTDSQGNQQWYKAFGGSGSNSDQGYCVQQTTDSGYIITGYTDSYGAGLYDMLLIKTDSSGNELWLKTFGGTGRDYGNSVQQTIAGNYIVAGYTLSYGAGNEDLWVVKTDSEGNKQWDETFGGTSSDVGYSVQQTTDGGYIVTGHTLSYGSGLHDVWLIKIESDETPLPLLVDAGGPYEGIVGETIEFIGNATGGVPPYDYFWDFGDSNTSTLQNPTHTYMATGNYTVKLTVTDESANSSSDNTWAKIEGPNNPPETPTIDGPIKLKKNIQYRYTFSTTDPDGDDVFYFVEWGDGSGTGWIDETSANHIWTTKDKFTIRCKAKDTNGAESDWGTLDVSTPRNIFIEKVLILRFIEWFLKSILFN